MRSRRHFSWGLRRPPRGTAATFDILLGWRWLVGGVTTLMAAFGLGLLVKWQKRTVLRWLIPLGLLGGIAVLVENFWGGLYPRLTRINLPIDELPPDLRGFSIGQLSDMHLGMPMSIPATRRAIRLLLHAQPDAIVLTGDFVSFQRHLPLLRKMLHPLTAPCGVYAVLGNHDHLEGVEAIAIALEHMGITLLRNEHRIVQRGAAHLAIAGVEDMWRGDPDLDQALEGIPTDAPIVLLAHAPDYADIAAQTRVAVQLSGHTHSGHVHMPLLGPLFLPRYGVYYHTGLHHLGAMWLSINNGLGGMPLRIGSRTEATLIRLDSGIA